MPDLVKQTKKLSLYFHTIRFLKPIQIWYQISKHLKRLLWKKGYSAVAIPGHLTMPFHLEYKTYLLSNSEYPGDLQFNLLNLDHRFVSSIDWSLMSNGKLWNYYLNYFNYLHQEGMDKATGLYLINMFLESEHSNRFGFDPYPISIRTVNWIKFVTRHSLFDKGIDQSLYSQLAYLSRNPEYHLLGNHLLENGIALIWGAYYFKDHTFYRLGKSILCSQLNEQILSDGGHFERSTMYHSLLLERLLDCYQMMHLNSWMEDELAETVAYSCRKMTGWLDQMTMRNGEVPCVNDAAGGIAQSSKTLLEYAHRLGLKPEHNRLSESGYRLYRREKYELLIDIGKLGPDYIPGHGHCDILSILMSVNGRPFIVDPGVSTYEESQNRKYERSTAAHNTVSLEGREQAEMWKSFRVGRRAVPAIHIETGNEITASLRFPGSRGEHLRRLQVFAEKVIITDDIAADYGIAFYHFHPYIDLELHSDGISSEEAKITFTGTYSIEIKNYLFAKGFNNTIKGKVAEVRFSKILKTVINL